MVTFVVILMLFGTLFISYLIGSIPTGYLIVKHKTGQDIRETGSGSTGATNVKRILGKKWFFIVMFLDGLKGLLPVLIMRLLAGTALFGLFPVVAAIGVIVGHSKPLFLGFKGGKSVASGIGTLYGLSFFAGLIITLIWGLTTWFSKYVSLGSIVALICAPVVMCFFGPLFYVLYTLVAAIYIIYLHRENIKRLIEGNESKVR